MATQHSLSHIDIAALAQATASLSGQWRPDGPATADPGALAVPMSRLAAESCVPNGLQAVSWGLQAELRSDAAGQAQPWLHIQANALIPLVCQRCLTPVEVALAVDRWFRFVADEATAAAEDDLSEEDVLALEPRMDVWALMEDELLMALPLVPMHDTCPVHVPTSVMDADFAVAEVVKPNPFAVLERLNQRDLL